ncbi:MAG: YceD family protein [Gammaproteobacteria bacterium]|nr:YceD family protein [Gammaproteobacteria bacterium]
MAMQERLPTVIDPYRLAEAGRELRGQIGLTGMDRLTPGLASQDGQVSVELRFGVDGEKVRYITGHIQTTLKLQCQRCMQPVDVVVDRPVSLGIVPNATDAEWLQPGYEPLIVDTPVVPLAQIVEDELLLAVPMVAAHDPGTCQANVVQEEEPAPVVKESPFAVLARLKKTSS